jgi:type VI protein secretion system component VasF
LIGRLIAAAPKLFGLVLQYRNDLHHPVAADSRERRLAAIEAVIAKVTGR